MLRIACIVILCVLLCSDARRFDARFSKHNEQWKEFEEFLKWKRTRQSRDKYDTNEFPSRAIGFDDDGNAQRNGDRVGRDPPPSHRTALMARYVVNQAGNCDGRNVIGIWRFSDLYLSLVKHDIFYIKCITLHHDYVTTSNASRSAPRTPRYNGNNTPWAKKQIYIFRNFP